MDDITVKRIDEIPAYDGPHALEGIAFRFAGKALGVSAWGMNVGDIAPGVTRWPEHDHLADGQEEVYVVLRGSVELVCGEQRTHLAAGAMARVPAHVRRTLHAGPEGARVLAIGGTPGKAYVSQF